MPFIDWKSELQSWDPFGWQMFLLACLHHYFFFSPTNFYPRKCMALLERRKEKEHTHTQKHFKRLGTWILSQTLEVQSWLEGWVCISGSGWESACNEYCIQRADVTQCLWTSISQNRECQQPNSLQKYLTKMPVLCPSPALRRDTSACVVYSQGLENSNPDEGCSGKGYQ